VILNSTVSRADEEWYQSSARVSEHTRFEEVAALLRNCHEISGCCGCDDIDASAVEYGMPCSITTKHNCTWCMCLAGQVAELHDCQVGAILDKQSISPAQFG